MHYLLPALILLIFLSKRATPKPAATLGEFKPVFQTVSGMLPNGQMTGNCFPACVASLLGLSLEEVPFFSLDSQKAQLGDANRWLKPRGLRLVSVRNSEGHKHPKGTEHYMLKGLSPRHRNYYHVVVGKDNKIVHDPHPDGRGIIGEPTNFFYLVSI